MFNSVMSLSFKPAKTVSYLLYCGLPRFFMDSGLLLFTQSSPLPYSV